MRYAIDVYHGHDHALTNGRPGYISDPVIDTSTNQIIYAHCVAANKPFGPDGPSNPYEILTHSEDRQGASVRSVLPAGYMTTTLEFAPDRKQILFHQAKSVDNIPRGSGLPHEAGRRAGGGSWKSCSASGTAGAGTA
jgi:hypothetical protein